MKFLYIPGCAVRNDASGKQPNSYMRQAIYILFACLILVSAPATAQEPVSDAKTVTIMAVNDMHAAIDMFPKLAGVIDSVRNIHPSMLLLSAGDNRTGNPINDRHEMPGYPMIDLMNRVGFNASAIGNHEFDSNVTAFRNLIEISNFRYLCANIEAHDSLRLHTLPFRFFERDGVRIGVLGLIQVGPNGVPDTHPNNVKGVSFKPVIEVAKNYMWMREQCDVLILLTHFGFEDDLLLADACPEVDIIIGGHSHTVVPSRALRNGVMITQTGRVLKYVTELQIEVSGGKVTGKNHRLIDLNTTKQHNKEIQNVVDRFNDNAMFNEVLTKAATPFENIEELGSLMADSQCAETNSEIALVNDGGVRYATHAAGDFLMKDAFMLDPFDNALITYEMTGQELEDAIISAYKIEENPFVSGITYTISLNTDNSVQKLSIYLPNGKPIDKKKTYRVVTNSYLASVCPAIQSMTGTDTFVGGTDALIKYLKKHPSISYQGVKRVTIEN
jgi:5''-nucleotidase/2'',3''-cyclic phosphodiesterase and related esterases